MKSSVLKFCFVVLSALLVSCVSTKKYNKAIEEAQSRNSEKTAMEEVLNKLVVENDSLKKRITELEELNRLEKEKQLALSGKKEDRGLNFKSKHAAISGKEEYDKKAIFLCSFLSYISWPDDNSDSFMIGIVGESPIKNPLSGCAYGKSVNKKPITVENYISTNKYKVIFFSEGGQAQFSKVKKQLAGKPVLLITENQLMEKIGSHITVFLDGAKVKFSANKNNLSKSGLKVSNSLYSLSE